MFTLKGFESSALEVRADLRRDVSRWIFSYELVGQTATLLDAPAKGQWLDWSRGDGLWQSTCFEAFIALPEDSGYWEFNFSPARRAWNVYRFEDYRAPQPPRPSGDFRFVSARSTSSSLEVILDSKVPAKELQLSLTAVLKTGAGTEYHALSHMAEKPDFHARASFQAWPISR